MSKPNGRPERRTVDVVEASYQPSKAELEEDLRVDATFDEAVQALARPAKVRYVGSVPVGGEILRQSPQYPALRTHGETVGVQWMSHLPEGIEYSATHRCVHRPVRAS